MVLRACALAIGTIFTHFDKHCISSVVNFPPCILPKIPCVYSLNPNQSIPNWCWFQYNSTFIWIGNFFLCFIVQHSPRCIRLTYVKLRPWYKKRNDGWLFQIIKDNFTRTMKAYSPRCFFNFFWKFNQCISTLKFVLQCVS